MSPANSMVAQDAGGVDAEHLKNQLLKHGKASDELQEELVEWALWLANTTPP